MIGSIALAAASRKFRRPDQHAITVGLSLLLLAAWIALSLFGAIEWSLFRPSIFRNFSNDRDTTETQFIASTIVSLLLCTLPIAAAVRERRHRQIAIDQPSNWSPGVATTGLLCVWLVSALLFIVLRLVNPFRIYGVSLVVLAIAATLVSFSSLLLAFRGTARATAFMMVLFVLCTWVGPIFADVFYHSVILPTGEANSTPWSITAFGPIGVLFAPWDPQRNVTMGLAFQILLATALLVLALMLESARQRRRHPPPLPVPVVDIP
ncbi:MAG: hypothetical protein JO353_10760 [Phycisphaerae bacterium]|nr:hypothetical protein [Phycisphaerae bacterium]